MAKFRISQDALEFLLDLPENVHVTSVELLMGQEGQTLVSFGYEVVGDSEMFDGKDLALVYEERGVGISLVDAVDLSSVE